MEATCREVSASRPELSTRFTCGRSGSWVGPLAADYSMRRANGLRTVSAFETLKELPAGRFGAICDLGRPPARRARHVPASADASACHPSLHDKVPRII
eukprot:6212478-Pleurochrysis_carterae.AAC.1